MTAALSLSLLSGPFKWRSVSAYYDVFISVTILGLVGPLFFISLMPSFLINPSRPLSF